MGTWKIYIAVDKPSFQVLLGTLLRVETNSVEGALFVMESKGVVGIAKVMIRLFHPLADAEKLLLRPLGHTGLVPLGPQVARPIQFGGGLVRTPRGSRQ